MNLTTNTITNSSLTLLPNSSNELPQVMISKWCWRKYLWAIYKLPSGTMLMSEKQLAKAVCQRPVDVTKFLKQHHLQGILVRVPNGSVTKAYTLSVFAMYLQLLLKDGLLNKHPMSLTRIQWEDLIFDLLVPQIKQTAIPNPWFFQGNYRVASAEPIQIKLEDNIELEVLNLGSGEYRIGLDEGMNCIDYSSEWLTDISPKRGQIFSRLNLSREVVECQVATSKCFKIVYTLAFDDWLTLWGYFGYHKNRKAIALLRAFAQKGIEANIGKILRGEN